MKTLTPVQVVKDIIQTRFPIRLFPIAIDMPWVAFNEMLRIFFMPWIRFLFFLHGMHWGQGWAIYGMPVIQRFRGSAIEIGDRVSLRSWKTANPVALSHSTVLATRSRNAVIRIGDDVG